MFSRVVSGLDLTSYVARMKNASLPEMLYRINRAFTVLRMRRNVADRKKVVRVPPLSDTTIHGLRMPFFVTKEDDAVIKAVLGGKIFTLNGELEALCQFEAAWSRTYFADIRPAPESVDIRMVWEPARLQHLTMLMVLAYQNPQNHATDDFKFSARYALIRWIRQNPFLSGPGYMSPMECGLRIPAFFYAVKTLDNLTMDERREILEALYLHAWWISRNLSLYSSLGNHTICECVGLVFAGAVFRQVGEGEKWLKIGMRLLKKEAQRQVLDDGGPMEQSLAYHRFVLDLCWLAIDFLESNALENLTVLKQRLSRAESFLDAFSDGRGSLPAIGDSDDGCAVAPGVAPKREVKAQWQGAVTTFPDAGYTVIKDCDGSLLTFDHGPLGMPPLYNHGHADALSITLRKGGRDFFVDCGTYQYNGDQTWRYYFRSTRAHNTVTVDGQDQADQETGFVWGRPYVARVMREDRPDGRSLIGAEHDGYGRLDHPVVHKRTIFQPDNSIFLVRDRFAGRGFHNFELNWHLHPDADVRRKGQWWRIANGEMVINVRIMGNGDVDLVRGSTDPVKGWYSPAYGIKETCPVLTCTLRCEPPDIEFVTVICTGPRIGDERILEVALRPTRSSL